MNENIENSMVVDFECKVLEEKNPSDDSTLPGRCYKYNWLENQFKGSVNYVMELLESLGYECYATQVSDDICDTILINYGRRRILKLKQYKNKGPEIYFNDVHLSKELRDKYAHIVTGVDTTESGQNIMYKLNDIPSDILREFVESIIKIRRV